MAGSSAFLQLDAAEPEFRPPRAGTDLQVFFAEQGEVAGLEMAVADSGQKSWELSCPGAVRIFHALILGSELDQE